MSTSTHLSRIDNKPRSAPCLSSGNMRMILLATVTLVAAAAILAATTAGSPLAWKGWVAYGLIAAPMIGAIAWACLSGDERVSDSAAYQR